MGILAANKILSKIEGFQIIKKVIFERNRYLYYKTKNSTIKNTLENPVYPS